jgi:hypothetical protein
MQSFGCSPGRRLNRRERTKAMGLNAKHRIEFTAEIFQSNNRRELHQLLVGEVPFETLKKTVGYSLVGISHTLG